MDEMTEVQLANGPHAELIAKARRLLHDAEHVEVSRGTYRVAIRELANALEAATQRGRLSEGEQMLVNNVRRRSQRVGKSLPFERALLAVIDRLAGEEVRGGQSRVDT